MEDVEIIDSFLKDFICGVSCIGCFIFFMIWVTIMMFIKPPENIDPNLTPILALIIWIVIGISFICFYAILEGFTKPRRFKITRDKIIFETPYKPIFKIQWSEFDKIHIDTKRLSDYPGVYGPTTHFIFNFIKEDSKRVYVLLVNKDFHKRTIIPEILRSIKQFASTMDKELRFITVEKGFASKMFHEIGFSD